MLSKPTTFIIGAGASKEFGLPDGRELMTQISQALDVRFDRRSQSLASGDEHIVETLRRHYQPKGANEWLAACRKVSAALPSLAASIDSFLDNHADDDYIQMAGRIAIVRQILNAEADSKLYRDTRHDYEFSFAPLDQTWIGYLFRALTQRCPKAKVGEFFKNARLVIFNYDRCVEHYFEKAISQSYGIPIGNAKRIVRDAEFIHVYGSIGALPEFSEEPQNEVEFGARSVQLIEAAKRIRTYTDRMEDSSAADRIRAYTASAEILVFLGFGFHPQNLDILAPVVPSKSPQIFATAHNVSAFNKQIYGNQLKSRFCEYATEPGFSNSCAELMQDYFAAF